MRPADARAAAILTVLLGLAPLCLWAAGRSVFWGDLVYINHPWRTLAAQTLQSGRLPLWDPYAYLGMPLAAQMQAGVWYPGSLPFHLFPFSFALALFHGAHFALAALLTFLWLRREGFTSPAAWGGAAVFAGSGVFLSHLPFLNHFSCLALLPGFLLFGRSPWLLGLAIALCFLSGYPPLLAGGAAAALVLSALGARPRPAAWLAAAGLAAAWGACLLLPALELVLGSSRGAGIGLEERLHFGFSLRDLPQFLGPLASGWERFSPWVLWWKSPYMGLTAAALAARGLAVGLRPRARAGAALYLAAALLLVLGASTPASRWLWAHLPPLRFVRYPGNMAYLFLPAVSLLVAAGLQGKGNGPRRGLWTRGACALVALELTVYAVRSQPTVPRDYFARRGPLARRLQAELSEGRYLLSPLALESHRGFGRDPESAALDLRHRLYGVANLPYRIESVGNFGEPLVPRPSYAFMDFLYSRPSLREAVPWLPWADARLVLTRDRLEAPGLLYEGETLWHVYRAPRSLSRALWLDPGRGAALPVGLGATPPDASFARPLEFRRPREDRWSVSADAPEGWAYVAEPRAPGWRFFLNGRPAVAEPALGPFQKWRVPSGAWRLDARYAPASWTAGLALTLLSLMACAAYWYNRLRRRLNNAIS